jgi:hypothetical protein
VGIRPTSQLESSFNRIYIIFIEKCCDDYLMWFEELGFQEILNEVKANPTGETGEHPR